MNFQFLQQPQSLHFLRAVCLTLVHSVWQGLILAALAGAVVLLTRKARPALRYNLLCFLLTGFLAGNCFTFYQIYSDRPVAVYKNTLLPGGRDGRMMEVPQHVVSESHHLTDFQIQSFLDFCGEHAGSIVAIWFLVFFVKTGSAAAGLLYVRKIRREQLYEVPALWKAHFEILAGKIGLGNRVVFWVSGLVQVPVVTGIWKPMVLVPLGMLSGLPFQEVEAILLHELAHIRRRDLLVNFIQLLAENVFFFNPGVLWISALIREEREHCCDDMAIGLTGNRTSFVQALVSFQEFHLSERPFALAFSRKKNRMLDRIKRIIYNNNKPLNAMEKLFVTGSLVAAFLLTAAISHLAPTETNVNYINKNHPKAAISPAPKPVMRPQYVAVADTIPKKKPANQKVVQTITESSTEYSHRSEGLSTYDITHDGKHYEIVKRGEKMLSLFVDSKQIPESEFADHKPEIDAIMKEVRIQQEQAELQRKAAEEQREQANVQRKMADEQRQQAMVLRDQAEQSRTQAEQLRKQADELRQGAEKMKEQAEKFREEAERQREKAEVQRKEAERERQVFEKMQSELIEDLQKAGLVKDKNNLSYKLNDEELVVDGKKQPESIHRKIREKYLKDKSAEMLYNYNGRTGFRKSGFSYTR